MQELREEAGLSRREMAERLGIKPTSLWKIENNRVEPKKSTVAKFCALLGLSLAYLYTKAFEKEDFLPDWASKPVLIIPQDREFDTEHPLPPITFED